LTSSQLGQIQKQNIERKQFTVVDL